jgi:hypothetical protein
LFHLCPFYPQICDLLASASWVPGITDMHHHAQLICWETTFTMLDIDNKNMK